MAALSGCAREPFLSPAALPTSSPPPLRGTALPQEAMGLVGAMTTITRPEPTVPPPAPATPAPTVSPAPLTGMALPQSEELSGAPPSIVAAELIAAGSALQLAGACREAIPLFEQAITIDPNFANVYALLGLCHYEQGQIDAAVARWQEALADDPLSPDALAGLGTALYAWGDERMAWSTIVRRSPSIPATVMRPTSAPSGSGVRRRSSTCPTRCPCAIGPHRGIPRRRPARIPHAQRLGARSARGCRRRGRRFRPAVAYLSPS
jgi:hypothetical protein